MTDYCKLKALSVTEWRYLAWALVLLPALRLALRVWGFQPVFSALKKSAHLPALSSTSPETETPPPFAIASLVRMVNAAADHGPVKANCLPRSMAIWWLLRRRGVDCELRLGVKPRDDAIQAHAWVESQNQVLNDDPGIAQQFSPFERVSELARWRCGVHLP